MTESVFQSSDSVRAARPLQYAESVTFDGPVALELGGTLPSVTVVYETYGALNPARANAVLICHALSGDSHVAGHDGSDDPGWWDVAVGPGKAIDTDKYFVICPNALGSCRGTTGPASTNESTGRRYGADFPTITTSDIVNLQRMLLDHLGVTKLLAVIGGSLGGHQALAWATGHPERVAGVVALATSARLTAQALAFDVVGRNAILRDPNFRQGQYYDSGPGPGVGLALARMLGHITYLSSQAMKEKFEADRLQPKEVASEFEKRFSVGSYLAYQGDKFVERFDANSYVTLSLAMDLFNLGTTGAELVEGLARSTARWLVVSFSSDWLFPPEQSREIVDALASLGKDVSYCNVASTCGHDAFLLPDNIETYGGLIAAFLANAAAPVNGSNGSDEDVYVDRSPASIFHSRRLDYDRIVELVPKGSSVLDLGCGRGTLLTRLKKAGAGRLVGVELDEKSVLHCVSRGLDVIQSDLNNGLGPFTEGRFDYVVLSHTLQAVRDVERVISDMLRVARRSVVSFPNFGYHKLRRMLAEEGRAPESSGLLRFKWYDTPNLRFFTIADFEEFCALRRIRVHQRIALDTEEGREVNDNPNLYADMAIFVLSR
jgi:homoserine O-acetyltransferase